MASQQNSTNSPFPSSRPMGLPQGSSMPPGMAQTMPGGPPRGVQQPGFPQQPPARFGPPPDMGSLPRPPPGANMPPTNRPIMAVPPSTNMNTPLSRPPGAALPGTFSGLPNRPPGVGPPPTVNGMSGPMMNGPPRGPSPGQNRPPFSQAGNVAPPPMVGQPYQKPTMAPPPVSQPPMPGPPMSGAPPMSRPPGPGLPPISGPPPPMGSQSTTGPPMASRPSSLPQPTPDNAISNSGGADSLPVPFHGQGQYSHTVHNAPTPTPLSQVPGSGPPSANSSRVPSPLPGTNYDAMEGQFTPQNTPANFPPGQSPPQQPVPPINQSGAPPPGATSGGIAGKRVYPQMQQGYNQPPTQTQQPGFNQQQPGFNQQQPGFNQQQPGFNQQQPGFNQQQAGFNQQQPGFNQQQPGFNQQQPGFNQQQPGFNQGLPPGAQSGPASGVMNDVFSGQKAGMPNNAYPNSTAGVTQNFGNLNLQYSDPNQRSVNLLQERHLLPYEGIEPPKAKLEHDFKKVNCSPEIFRCTLSTMPQTQSLLNKCRLPLGILIHPFKDLSQLPVIQSSVIVRCKSCRTYINPFVTFVDQRRWKCNLCYRVNDLPEEFSFDPVSKTYGDPQRRPEIKSATIEFIAPSEYMLRPPQPAVYLYLLDVSFNAVETGYLQIFCQTLLDEIDRIPGDSRTQIGFITYDSSLHYYYIAEDLSQPKMFVVSDIDDVFLPSPDGLLCNLTECRDLVVDLLTNLPTMFEGNKETGSALGAALLAAHKLTSPTGGRVSVFQTVLPSVGPGALKAREDPNQRAAKNVQHMGPATDFYKKLSLDCSAQQTAVDVFFLNSQYIDIASIACISKYSGGCIQYYPGFHITRNVAQMERFENDLRRYFTRKIGFESVMRIRCTKGLSIHTFHGNFFVRSTDLLSLPNINPDTGFGMQMSIEEPLTDLSTVCFQAALLYTSSKGERRIRVHTMCLPVSNQQTEIYAGADQQAIIGLLAKMGVDRCIGSSMQDAREAMKNAAIDLLSAFSNTLPSGQRMGALNCPFSLRLMPLYISALLKYNAFRVGSSTKLDDRVFSMEMCKSQPLAQFMLTLYPSLYPVHALDDRNAVSKGDQVVAQPQLLQLSFANIDRHGAYLLDAGDHMYLYVGAAISDKFCSEVLDAPNFQSVPETMNDIPELENETSERLRVFINYLIDQRPFYAPLTVIRDDSRARMQFVQYMVEDRTESSLSYYEFLQHIQPSIK